MHSILDFAFTVSLAAAGAHAVEAYIYENASATEQYGVGMGFWPRTWESLCTHSLEDELRPLASSDRSSSIQYLTGIQGRAEGPFATLSTPRRSTCR
ncbi:hypothetical protein PsYK624_114950 [Phanerochaete sordida]|uniref:Uncharacterized protein n=1 Tax=Phanerochaete sordida TaxID=48140 RepID=A0A9P3GIC4_9APHY|nr:hypothetical protein PsYK624_114950 [Phanerochaete sordida]